MNKKIKRIIAVTLTVSAFSAIAPAKYFDLTTNKVYASTYGISDLQVNDGSTSSDLQLYSSSSCNDSHKVDFSLSSSKYYVETYENGINVEVDADSGYYVRVSKKSSGTDGVGSGERIHIANGDTTSIYVKVFDNSTDKIVKTYTISVKQLSDSKSSSYDDDDDYDYDNDDAYLSDIRLSDGNISFSKSKSTYNVNVDSSVDQIRVKAEPEDDDYTVKINGYTVDDNDDYKRTVYLTNGQNEITIRVRDDDNRLRTYTLYVYRGGSASSSSNASAGEVDNYQDDIYLDDLILDNNQGQVNINFRPKVTTYNVNVNSNCDSVILKATPEEEDNIVRINGEKVNSKNSRRVELKEGKNIINVKVDNSNDYETDDDDYENRIYTINVYRGTSVGNANNVENNSSSSSVANTNQWVLVDGRWQFNDYSGKPLKSQWFYDNGYQKWFYLDSEGFMKTGWFQLGPSWYYFNANGTMAIGWIQDGGAYYHLGSNGVMDHDTTIDRYVLGSNGAWIG